MSIEKRQENIKKLNELKNELTEAQLRNAVANGVNPEQLTGYNSYYQTAVLDSQTTYVDTRETKSCSR